MVVQGEVWLDQNSLRQLVHHAPAEAESRRRLTDRDRQVMRGVFEGLANKEIADRLQISESSVKASLQQLFDKTGVRTRSQLVRVALEQYREQLL
jgi:DNA-binding NarL/FixJ family response regulator